MKQNLTQIYQGESMGLVLRCDTPLDGWGVAAKLFTSEVDYKIVCARPAREGMIPIECDGNALTIDIPASDTAKLSEGVLFLHLTLTRGGAVKKATARLAEVLPASLVADQRTTVGQQLVFADNEISLTLDMGPGIPEDGVSPTIEVIEGDGSTVLEITDVHGTRRTRNLQTPANLVHTPGQREDAAMSQKGATELASATLAVADKRAEGYASAALAAANQHTTEQAAQALADANNYTDTQIAAIPVPDVSGQIGEHNASGAAHADLRELLRSAVGLPSFDPKTYTLTFTAHSGATVVVDLPIESMGLDYDPAAKEMIYTNADGTKRRISLAEFIDVYTGSVGAEIQITVDSGNVIRAKLLTGSVTMEHLNAALQSLIRGKVDASPGKGLSTNDYTSAEKAEVAKIKDKEDAQIVENITGSAVVLDLAGGHTYLCGELTSLEIRSVADSPRPAIVRFRSGTAATTLTIPAELKIVGYARPEANYSYEINIESRLGFINRF